MFWLLVWYFLPTPQAQLGDSRDQVLAKYECCSATCRQMWVAAPTGEKAVTGNIVFNLAGVISSSWPSCLLSGCGHDIQAPHLRHHPGLVGGGGHFPAFSSVPRILWLGDLSD